MTKTNRCIPTVDIHFQRILHKSSEAGRKFWLLSMQYVDQPERVAETADSELTSSNNFIDTSAAQWKYAEASTEGAWLRERLPPLL